MSENLDIARKFFEACETGKGWEGCKQYCLSEATFSAQAGVLSEITTVADYTNWMKDLMTPLPDGRYELRFFAEDEERNSVAACAVFHGTQTGPGGPVPPTNKTAAADYAYLMQFDSGLIKHMTKIWNDTITLQQIGWA